MANNWTTVTISDLVAKGEAEIKTGPFGTQLHASDYVEEGTPVLNAGNIGFGDIRINKLDYISDETVKRLSSHLLQSEDIIFGRKGTVERHAFIRDRHTNWFQGTDCLRLRLKSPSIEPRFVSYYFLTDYHKQWIKNQSSHGATMTSLNQAIIGRITFALPPLPAQRRIADILSTYDDLIENNMRRIRILEGMAQAIYAETLRATSVRDKESLPEGWEMKTLGDVCNIVMGQSPASEFYNEEGKGLPFHQGVTNFGDRFPTDKIFCTVENRIAEKGDVLFSVRAPVGRLNISTKKIVVGRGICAIRSKTGNQSFVFQQLKEQFHEDDMMGGGTIFKSVTKDDVHGIKFLLPPKDIIEKFETFANPISRELEILTAKNANLRQTRDLLLPRLVSGEITV